MTIRYLDSGARDGTDCLGRWLDSELVEGIRSFRGQYGYFDIHAMHKYLRPLEVSLARGGLMRLVLGSNAPDPPSTADLEPLLELQAAGDAKITVVAFANALFHPKVTHIQRRDGSACAAVGSANLTVSGLGHNVEAVVILEDEPASREALDCMAATIDSWSTNDDPGVYQIQSRADLDTLVALGLLVSPQSRQLARRGAQREGTLTGRGHRRRTWRPPPLHPPLEVREALPATEWGLPAALQRTEIVSRWAKRLPSSDAQQVQPGTNPTGKLRLAKAGFPIDHGTYFRYTLFGQEDWIRTERNGKPHDEASVPFYVSLDGEQWESYILRIDHAPHREANQHNVPTVLSWGAALGAYLHSNDRTGHWVTIEKDQAGNFWLTLQPGRPAWAPG